MTHLAVRHKHIWHTIQKTDDNGSLPYGVVSLLHVLKFAADDFWKASQTLSEWSRECTIPPMSRHRIMEIGNSFAKFVEQVRTLSLPVTFKELEKLREWTERTSAESDNIQDSDAQIEAFTNMNREFGQRLTLISSVLHSEIESRIFFHMPPERAAYYAQTELFGSDVHSKFPDLQFDIEEAGNCYATGRGTASVFHLMRVMETGVQKFGNKLGVAFPDQKNWQPILDEINKAVRALPPKDKGTVAMSEVSANLYAVKLAWRNEVMHPKETYTLEEAEDILRQVKLFMKQLTAII
jgi:hypothetical protein